MKRYIKASLILHAVLLLSLVTWTVLGRGTQKKRMKFVILPKGTSLNAVMTPELAKAVKERKDEPAHASLPPNASTPAPAPEVTPQPTVVATPPPPAVPEETKAAAPAGTPEPKATPTPTPEPQPTKVKPELTPNPKPKPTKSKTELTPTPKPSPTKKASVKTPTAKEAEQKTKAEKTPRPKKPDAVTDAIELESKEKQLAANLPKQTPSNVKPQEAKPGDEVGIPGVAEGVEGAPLPLDHNQSVLSMLYTTRARMKIQTNFTVPPGVNDPDMTCVVEWEILPDGTIQNARVVKSSGITQHDACAIEALTKTENIGPLPPEFGRESIWTSLTFVYAGGEDQLLEPVQRD